MQATWPQAELLMHGSYAEAMDPRMNYHWAADRPSTHLHDRAPCGKHHVLPPTPSTPPPHTCMMVPPVASITSQTRIRSSAAKLAGSLFKYSRA